MKNRALVLALGFGVFLLLCFLADRPRILADSNSTGTKVADLIPTPTPCSPPVPCGLGYTWDTKFCQCVPTTPVEPLPWAPFTANTSNRSIVAAPTPYPGSCSPTVPCGLGYHWDVKLCQCEPDIPPLPIPVAGSSTPISK